MPCFDLCQDYVYKRGKMSLLPTITEKCKRMWFRQLRRWLLGVELAYAHGFPVVPKAARDAGVMVDSNSYTKEDLGNCTRMANDGAVLAIALACVQRK